MYYLYCFIGYWYYKERQIYAILDKNILTYVNDDLKNVADTVILKVLREKSGKIDKLVEITKEELYEYIGDGNDYMDISVDFVPVDLTFSKNTNIPIINHNRQMDLKAYKEGSKFFLYIKPKEKHRACSDCGIKDDLPQKVQIIIPEKYRNNIMLKLKNTSIHELN